MKLLRLTLEGEYKGLTSQTFDFSHSQGNVIAFIGLNGSGKSQLLELIAESFAYVERLQRKTPIASDSFFEIAPLGFKVTLEYLINSKAESKEIKYKIILGSHRPNFYIYQDNQYIDVAITSINNIILPSIIGYASGLHENLQRPFMKNTLQFYETIRVKQKRTKELAGIEVNEEDIVQINKKYKKKYPYIFSYETFILDKSLLGRALGLEEINIPTPNLMFIDYDCSSLLIASLSVLSHKELTSLFPEVRYHLPCFIKISYDFSGSITGEDSIKDIKLLRRIVGINNHHGKKKASEELFELYELDFLSGEITIDLSDKLVQVQLMEAHYNEPLTLFNRLYKFQILGTKYWHNTVRKNLLNESFIGTVKKPIKGKLPLTIKELKLANSSGEIIDFDDLSDGEAQLMEILASVRLFKDEETLFLFDEPETHLNPAWRTNFHKYIENALGENNNNQVFLSTHSPFMISSLKASNVFYFERNHEEEIQISTAEFETYGASFDVLIKQFFNLRSLISQTAVQEIKQKLEGNPHEAKDWIEKNLGDSMDKAYLLRKLQGTD